jgi:hypothetical protein
MEMDMHSDMEQVLRIVSERKTTRGEVSIPSIP